MKRVSPLYESSSTLSADFDSVNTQNISKSGQLDSRNQKLFRILIGMMCETPIRMIEGTVDQSTRVTLAEVANESGVSMATASKVLNGRSGVSKATRERVLDVISKLGYEPIVETRRNTDARTIGVVLNTLRSRYTSELLQGIVEAGNDWDVGVAVTTSDQMELNEDRSKELETWIQIAAERDYAALILASMPLTSSQLEICERHQIPLVVIDPIGTLPRTVPSISATNWAGSFEATEHLITLGHKNIGFAGGPLSSTPATERYLGFRSAMDKHNLEVVEENTLTDGFTYEAGISMGRKLLSTENVPTAIVTGSDPSAMGVIEASREAGLAIPLDLSVVGFDDTQVAAWSSPPLTTVRQPLAEMGRLAMRTALDLSSGESAGRAPVQLTTSLITRGSTSTPRVQ